MAEKNVKVGVELGLGWLPDYPDFRDYDIGKKVIELKQGKRGVKESVSDLLTRMDYMGPGKVSIPTLMDLRGWCPPVENQGPLGSCTANAGVGLLEYYERRAFGKHIDASRLFL